MAKKGKVLQTIIKISGEISPTLGKSMSEITDKLDGLNVKALAAGAAIGGIAAGTAIAVGKAVGSLAKLGDAYNSALNDISSTTGLVGDELAGMGDVMKDVYGDNFGESMGDVAGGVSEIYRQTGLVDDALAETTKGAYALQDTFGYELTESARAAKAMMTNFGVSGEEAMNLIATGAQNGLDFSGEMIDSINEYSVQFAKLGFTADDMFNIFQQGADSGAWNLDKVGDAVKEFSIRSIDSSETTKHAFESLGLNAYGMMDTFAAGGDEASIAFSGVLDALMGMDDQVQRDLIGVELFGTQWEDLGIEAMQAMADMQGGAYATTDAIGQIADVKYDNITDAMEAIKRKGEVALLPLASTVAKAFTEIAPILGDVFETIGPIIEQVTEDAMPFLTEFLDGIKGVIPKIMPMISSLASTILPLLSTFVQNLLPPLLSLIENLLPPLMNIIEQLMPAFTQILLAILPMITQIISAILPVLATLLDALLPLLTPILDTLSVILNDVIMPLMEPILAIVEAILPVLAPLISGLLEPLRFLADVLSTIVGWIAKVVGWVSEGLTWVVGLIFGDGAGKVADAANENGYSGNVVNRYAAGGFTNGLSIAGEDPRYPTEAVLSFNPAYREQNLSYWARAGRMLGADVSDFSLSGGSSGSYVDMGGITFAPKITVTGHADKESIMEAIEEEYDEFTDMLEEWIEGRKKPAYV